jgi:hypothetical protein
MRKRSVMRVIIMCSLRGGTGLCGEAELLAESPEGTVEGDADIGACSRPRAGDPRGGIGRGSRLGEPVSQRQVRIGLAHDGTFRNVLFALF